MSQQARVTSTEALQDFYVTLIKIIEDANASLTAADMQARRAIDTIKFDRKAHWERELKKRHEELSQAKIALKARQNAPGKQDITEQEAAVKRAQARVKEAEEKLEAIRKWGRALEKAHEEYSSKSRKFRDMVEGDPPPIVAAMDRINQSLENYVQFRSTLSSPGAGKKGGAAAGPGGGGGASDEIDPRKLRDSTPTLDGRNRALGGTWVPRAGMGEQPVAVEPTLAVRVGQVPQIPGPEAGVTVDPQALAAGTFYVERVTGGLGRDSGWHLGGLNGPAEAVETHSVAALIERYPVLAEVLALGTGSLAVVRRGQLDRAYDRRDAELKVTDAEALPPT